jgi:hypothetical protein
MKSAVGLAVLAGTLLAGCATTPAPTERDSASPCRRSELYFGQKTDAGAAISGQQWSDFVATNIARRFPDGFTICDATGSWRNAQNGVQSEPTKILVLLYPQATAAAVDQQLSALAQDYIRDFHQEAVLRDDAAATMEFYNGTKGR